MAYSFSDIKKKIGVIDFGGQYAHLISSRIRRLGAFTEILTNEESLERYKEFSGLIFSGGPSSVYEKDSPSLSKEVIELGIPILGICYGHQLLMKLTGGIVEPSNNREYGLTYVDINLGNSLLISKGLTYREKVWMSHGDEVVQLPEGFFSFAQSEDCKNAGVIHSHKKIIGLQFHPEVYHTEKGFQILQNFINICGVSGTWDLSQFLESKINELRETIPQDKKVFMLISGGVDSTVSYILLSKALGANRVKGLLIDTGFMRKNEVRDLKHKLDSLSLDVLVSNESDRFYSKLANVTDPETKRKIMGQLFLEAKKECLAKLNLDPKEWILGQGTIYPDTIESGGTKHSHSIKTHHNRVDEILELLQKGEVVEPIKELYKDEVRELGCLLGIEREWTMRHPFPGPGLAVRMITSISTQFPDVADKFTEVLKEYPNAQSLILPVSSVGVQGDKRSYKNCALLTDFTKDWNVYNSTSTKITNTISQVNRVVFLPFHKELPKELNTSKMDLDLVHSNLLREADHAVNEVLIKYRLMGDIWQFPVVLLPVGKALGDFSIVLRPVESQEAMTANFYPMNRTILEEMVEKISKIPSISYVFYDITNKPPGTIEWE